MTNDGGDRKRALLNRLISECVDPMLSAQGFVRVGRKATWIRTTSEVSHLIGLDGRGRSSYVAQWGVHSPEAAALVWGETGDRPDVRWCVLTGLAQGVVPDAASDWVTAGGTPAGPDLRGAREAVVSLTNYLSRFQTRRDLWTYLLEDQEPKDRRGFLIPMNLPLKLFVAAALATIDGDPEGEALRAQAMTALAPFSDRINQERLVRLASADASRR